MDVVFLFFYVYLVIIEWRLVGYEEFRRFRPRWITPSEICRILHILRKPNSIIVLTRRAVKEIKMGIVSFWSSMKLCPSCYRLPNCAASSFVVMEWIPWIPKTGYVRTVCDHIILVIPDFMTTCGFNWFIIFRILFDLFSECP